MAEIKTDNEIEDTPVKQVQTENLSESQKLHKILNDLKTSMNQQSSNTIDNNKLLQKLIEIEAKSDETNKINTNLSRELRDLMGSVKDNLDKSYDKSNKDSDEIIKNLSNLNNKYKSEESKPETIGEEKPREDLEREREIERNSNKLVKLLEEYDKNNQQNPKSDATQRLENYASSNFRALDNTVPFRNTSALTGVGLAQYIGGPVAGAIAQFFLSDHMKKFTTGLFTSTVDLIKTPLKEKLDKRDKNAELENKISELLKNSTVNLETVLKNTENLKNINVKEGLNFLMNKDYNPADDLLNEGGSRRKSTKKTLRGALLSKKGETGEEDSSVINNTILEASNNISNVVKSTSQASTNSIVQSNIQSSKVVSDAVKSNKKSDTQAESDLFNEDLKKTETVKSDSFKEKATSTFDKIWGTLKSALLPAILGLAYVFSSNEFKSKLKAYLIEAGKGLVTGVKDLFTSDNLKKAFETTLAVGTIAAILHPIKAISLAFKVAIKPLFSGLSSLVASIFRAKNSIDTVTTLEDVVDDVGVDSDSTKKKKKAKKTKAKRPRGRPRKSKLAKFTNKLTKKVPVKAITKNVGKFAKLGGKVLGGGAALGTLIETGAVLSDFASQGVGDTYEQYKQEMGEDWTNWLNPAKASTVIGGTIGDKIVGGVDTKKLQQQIDISKAVSADKVISANERTSYLKAHNINYLGLSDAKKKALFKEIDAKILEEREKQVQDMSISGSSTNNNLFNLLNNISNQLATLLSIEVAVNNVKEAINRKDMNVSTSSPIPSTYIM